MAKSSDIIKIGFDYRASLEQFVKETNGVFDGISEKAGKQRISIQLDAKNDKVIEKIKELQKLKLDGFTFEFGESGLAEQLKTFDQLEKKINEIINLSKGINNIGSGNGIGNSIVDEKSLNSIIDLFGKMENHLGEIKKVFADVGDGEEFSPLLKMINDVQVSIKELSTSVSKIKLDVNMDLGSGVNEERLNQKVSQTMNRQLEAYRNLFAAMKSTGKTNKEMLRFFEPDDASISEIIGAYKGMIKRAEEQFGKDIYKNKIGKDTYSAYIKEIKNATDQFNRATNKKNTENPLGDLFGKNELIEVVSQLGLIADRLSEISSTVSGLGDTFKNVFKEGFNVSASVEEIEKLTSRVKELEDELSKVKASSTSPVETNISSPIKDTFQGDISNTSAVEQQNKLQEELHETQEEAKKARDIISQVGLRQTYITHEPDDNGNMVEHERGQYSFIERLQDGQLRNVLVTYDENTQKWTEDTLSLSTAFEKVGKEIISLDNKINQYKNARSKTLESHPTYDFSADDALIAQTEKRRQILLDTLALYDREGEYQYEIVEFEKRRAENAERLKNITKKQENLSDAKQGEKFQKDFNKAYEEAVQINKALNETKSKVDGLSKHSALSTQFTEVETTISSLNKKLAQGELAVFEYNKAVKETVDNYSKLVGIQQRRDVEVYNADAKRAEELQRQADAEVAYYKKRDEEYERLRAQYKAEGKAQEDAYNAQVLKEQAEAWEKNVKAIQEYMDANTKLNNLKAQDAGTGKKAKEIEYNVKKVEELEKAAIEARAILSSMINPHEAPIDDWNKWLDVMKQFDQATEGSAESLAKLEDSLRNMAESQFKKVNDTLSNSEKYLELLKPTEGNRSVSFEKVVQEYDRAVNSLKEFHATLDATTPLTKEQSDKFEKLANDVKKARIEIDKIPKSQRGSDEDARMKEIDKLTKYLDANTRISKKARQELEHYLDILKSGNPSVSVKELHTEWTRVAVAEREAGREGKRFWDIITDKAVYGAAAQLAGYYLSLTDFIRYAQNGIQTIREFDTALTEMRKVSDETVSSLERFQDISFDLADGVGTTAKAIQDATADWMRLGESLEDAKQSAQDANVLFRVSEFESIDEATESLVAMSAAYKDLEKSQINDVLNEIGNNYAISTDELASALQKSAATLSVAGNDIYEAAALVTAGNAVLQDADSVGTGLKMISLRILGTQEAKDELASLGEDVDDFVVQTKSKIDETVRNFTAVASNDFKGISVLDDNGNYRSTYEILRDISQVYQEILETDKKAGTNRGQALLEVLAGKNRSNVAASILQSPELLTSAYESAMNSAGSAQEELDKFLESIDGKHLPYYIEIYN